MIVACVPNVRVCVLSLCVLSLCVVGAGLPLCLLCE